jgi:Tripartite tricarboxylate transporter TctB family
MSIEDQGSPASPSDVKAAKPLAADLIIPVLAGAFTTYFLVETNHLTWEAKANGVVIGTLLLALVAIQVLRAVVSRARGAGRWSFGELTDWNLGQRQRLIVIGTLIIFVATIGYLGTTLALFLVMGVMMWTLGVRRWQSLLVGSLGVAAAVYLAFIVFLGTRLPEGPIEQLLASFGGGA